MLAYSPPAPCEASAKKLFTAEDAKDSQRAQRESLYANFKQKESNTSQRAVQANNAAGPQAFFGDDLAYDLFGPNHPVGFAAGISASDKVPFLFMEDSVRLESGFVTE